MRYHTPLDHIFPKAQTKCLRCLCKYPSEMNGTQLARVVGISVPTLHRVMKGLVDEKIVVFKQIGNNHLYKIDPKNSIVSKLLMPLFVEEENIYETLKKNIRKVVQGSKYSGEIISVALFGSIEEKRERPNSDIDLLVVTKGPRDAKHIEDIFFDADNPALNEIYSTIEPFVKTAGQFAKEKDKGIVKSILASHTLILGKRLEEIIWSQRS